MIKKYNVFLKFLKQTAILIYNILILDFKKRKTLILSRPQVMHNKEEYFQNVIK